MRAHWVGAMLVVYLMEPMFCGTAHAADWMLDASARANYNNNPAFAIEADQIEGEVSLATDVAAGQSYQLTDRLALSLTANLAGEYHAQFSGLDNVGAGASAALGGKLGLGLDAPWWRVSGGAMFRDYDFSPRDGMRYFASAAIGRRWGERLSTQIGYQFDATRSSDVVDIPRAVTVFGLYGDAFNLTGNAIAVQASYDISPRWTFQTGYARRYGTVCSSTRIDRDVLLASSAVARDPVFGVDRVAYRVNAPSNFFNVLLNYALADQVAMEVTWEHRDATTGDYIAYSNNVTRLVLHYSY